MTYPPTLAARGKVTHTTSMRLCSGGTVTGGPFWQGTDYACTGSATTEHGVKIICTDPSHEVSPG